MKTVTWSISSRAAAKPRMAAVFAGEAQGEFILFATVDLLWMVLSVRLWKILQAMTGAGELSKSPAPAHGLAAHGWAASAKHVAFLFGHLSLWPRKERVIRSPQAIDHS